MSVVDDAFVRESTTRARELSNALIAVERDPDDDETIDEAFRVAHTLKGNCGAAGLDDASDLAHAVEDVLEAIRRDSLEPTGDVVDDALAAVDDVEDVVRAAGRGETASVDADTRIEALRDRLDESIVDRNGDGSDGGVDADAEVDDRDAPEIEFPEMPTEGQDISAEEALDRASVFDDIDQLVDEMDDDAEEFADLGNAGTFDQLVEADEAVTADAEAADPGAGVDPEPEPASEPEPADDSGTLDQAGNVGDVFAEIKSEVDDDGDDVDELQTEIESVQFGEFDDDDDMTIQELIEGDADEPTAEAGAGAPGVDPEPTVPDAADTGAGGETAEAAADAEAAVDAVEAAGESAPALDEEPALDLGEVVDEGAAPEPLAADATSAVTEAPADPRTLATDVTTVVTEAPADPRTLAADAEPAVTEAPAEPRALAADATPAVTEAPTDPRALATDATPAVTEASTDPRTLATDATPAVVAAGVRPRAFPEDAEPAVTATTTDPRALVTDTEPAVTATTTDPRALATDTEPAVTATTTDPRALGDAEPAIVAASVEARALGDELPPAVTSTPTEPRGFVADAEPVVSPADAGPSPVTADDPGASVDDTFETFGEAAADDGVDDGGFEWADGFAADDGEAAEADDVDADEPSVEDLVAGIEEAVEDEPVAAESADAEPAFELETGSEPEPPVDLDDDEAGEVPSIEDLVDVDEPALDDEPTEPEAGTLGGEPDLGEMDADVEFDADAGVGGDAESPEPGDDLPDLPELDVDGIGSGAGAGSDFDVAFDDDETAAFESRFSTAFEDAEEVAAVEAAAAAVNSATTIEESEADPTAFGGDRPPEPATDPGERTAEIQTLTVDVENADELLTLAETLTVSRLQIEGAIDPDNEAAADALSELSDVASNFRRTVMDIRLMPLRTVVDTLPRVVRDVARREDKDVQFVTEGTDVRLDRSVIDRIGDPLIHLVRNAVDHGIEPPDVREANGKDPTGRVELRAEQRRDSVVVEVIDDGDGIDPDAVRAGAVEDGMLTVEEAEALSDEEVHELLFRPGFTTASEVTEVSGRGVGMDVVDRVLTELDGSVEIDSAPGEGTTVRLTLPVTVAMADVWLVESGGETFAVPARAVEQIEDPRGAEVVDGREVFSTPSLGLADGGDRLGVGVDVGATADAEDDEPVPLVRLREAFDTPGERNERGMVLRMREGARPLALHVDSVIEQQEVVVKPYGELLGDVPGVTGATLRGDGQLVNVVDVDTIGDRA